MNDYKYKKYYKSLYSYFKILISSSEYYNKILFDDYINNILNKNQITKLLLLTNSKYF